MNYLRQLNLFGKVADIPYDLIGTSDPTSSTEARAGMGYFNRTSRAFFICVDDTPGAYVWLKTAGGGSTNGESGSGEPGVGITSITTVSTSDESDGVNVYALNLSDGSSYTIEVKNGSAGKDYVLTAEDKAEIANEAYNSLPEWAKAQEKPTYTAEEVGADTSGTADNRVAAHNTSEDSHNDIRLLISGLSERLNALANSTDEDLDQMAEVVAYIQSNKSLIDSITTSKVSVADIIDNLATNVSNKPLSAAQGVALKALYDELKTGKLDASALTDAINTALAQAKESGEFDGSDGVSPVVSVSDVTGGHRITITDASGTKTVDVMDGTDGSDGRGIVSVQRTSGDGSAGSADIYTITYSDATTSTFSVYNGADGVDYTLTETDKTEIAQQAAGLVNVDGVVKSTEQTFTDDEKAQVRTNIGAASASDVSELSDKIEDIGGNVTPDYIVAEAERVVSAVQATRTAKSLVFPIMSDFHLFDGSSDHADSLISAQYAEMGVKELKKRMHIDFIGYLGDYTWSADDCTAEQVMRDITAAKETTVDANTEIWCVGNHDTNYGKNRDRLLTMDELYGYIGANSDGVKPFVNTERCYGYMDFVNQKIRVIYLNTNDTIDWDVSDGVAARAEWISPTQIQWLANTALDFSDKTIPSEWAIVIVGHHPLHYAISCFANVMKLLEAYQDGLSGTISCTLRQETEEDGTTSYVNQTVSYDFANIERAEIICNIHGHNHNCGYSKISSTTMSGSTDVEPWLWRFCVPNICANRYNTGYSNFETNEVAQQNYGEFDESGNPVYWTKETGTAKATSFNVVNIDRKNKKIYAYSFGAGKDRVFDYGAVEKPAYINQIPISTGTGDEIYNGTGYNENLKISSTNGNETTASGCNVTGFIPIPTNVTSHAEGQVVLYLANIEALPTDENVRFAFYDSEKNYICLTLPKNGTEGYTQYKFNYWLGGDGYINKCDCSTFIMNQAQGANYVRVCAPGLDGDSIITVNKPIE